MTNAPAADVVLVGLGAAGGIAADVLTRAGLNVVALEAGPRLDPGEMTLDEIRNDVRSWMSEPKARHEVPTLRTSPAGPAQPTPWPMLMVNAVGGTTLHYPALSIRLQPWNFRSRSATIERYGVEAIPAGSTLSDWPLDYDELEPCYEAVERAIGVSGRAGNAVGGADPAGNPFEGHAPALSAARAAPDGVDRADGRCGAGARLAPVPRTRSRQHAGPGRPAGVHVLRVLLVERLLCRRAGIDGCHRHPSCRGDRTAADRDRRPRRWRSTSTHAVSRAGSRTAATAPCTRSRRGRSCSAVSSTRTSASC